ncbi:MAG: hypothetical protein ACRCUM_02310, partial [Mycoplasmoidaceae bacterium]
VVPQRNIMNKKQLQATLDKLQDIYLDVINFPYKEKSWLEGAYEIVNNLFNEVHTYALEERNFTELQEESAIISKVYRYARFIKKNINEVLQQWVH